MKSFLVSCLFLIIAVISIKAIEPVTAVGLRPESAYNITQTDATISSTTVSTDAAVNGYRAMHVFNVSATTFYYRIDGSTSDIVSDGWPVAPWTSEKIETNGTINYLLISGATASITVRKKEIRK